MHPFESSQYLTASYNNQARFNSYWNQVNEVLEHRPDRVLEIGIGTGLVAWHLRRLGIDVVTLDVDERLEPDVVGSVLSIPLEDRCFDAIACFEVLEHLPFRDLPEALAEIYRVTNDRAFISLPDTQPRCRMFLHIPRLLEARKVLSIRRPYPREHEFDGEHRWEIGKDGLRVEHIVNAMEKCGFAVARTHVPFEVPSQRFFQLRRKHR